MENQKHEFWVDDVRGVACILVVLGHFFQSMVRAMIIPDNSIYEWFNRTIYYFHVPLFFICSGYLYQKTECINSVRACEWWVGKIKKKLLTLGVPYVVFSLITWGLKNGFFSTINSETGGIVESLLLHPMSPYWFLYILFFIFIATPIVKERKSIKVLLGMAIGLRLITEIFDTWRGCFYILEKIGYYEVWFVLGMALWMYKEDFNEVFFWHRKPIAKICSLGAGVLFVTSSIFISIFKIEVPFIGFFMGVIACSGLVIFTQQQCKIGKRSVVLKYLSGYTLEIFLMHTIFAAGMRSILLRLGVQNWGIHFIIGIGISFVGPIVIAEIFKKSKYLEIFIRPEKLLKLDKNK